MIDLSVYISKKYVLNRILTDENVSENFKENVYLSFSIIDVEKIYSKKKLGFMRM